MKFKIGAWNYRVKLSERPLIDELGHRCDGLCAWSERTIFIDAALPLEQRREQLYHELAHCYEKHFGMALDREDVANRTSTIIADVWQQFERQGGLAALANLQPDGIVEDGASGEDIISTSYAIKCGTCSGLIALGGVVNGRPTFSDEFNRLVVERQAYCEYCNATQTWVEAATSTGKPTGKVLSGPVSHTGNRIYQEQTA